MQKVASFTGPTMTLVGATKPAGSGILVKPTSEELGSLAFVIRLSPAIMHSAQLCAVGVVYARCHLV